MKTRIFLVAAALMLFASMSFGQGFSAWLYDDSFPLSVTCGGSDYYPDGSAMIKIFWDANQATLPGPDPADVQPTVGDAVGNVNFNEFQINGDAWGFGPGGFGTDYNFSSVGVIPDPPYYYLVIDCPDGSHHWVSADCHLTSTSPVDVNFTSWTCTPCFTPPSCTADQLVTLTPDAPLPGPQTATACVHLVPGTQTLIEIPVSNASNIPTVSVTAGCAAEPNCNPSPGWVLGAFAYLDTPAPHFYGYITGESCCATLHLDNILAATIESFTGAPGDNEVILNWATGSETNLQRFDILRNAEVVGHVNATNVNGANYSFTDKNAHNGTTYTYGLRLVNNDNSVQDVNLHVTATPSFNAAVVTEYALLQNYPNPFNPTTEIAFDVLNTNPVTLKVYNAAGQVVATLLNGATKEGGHRYAISFDATNLTSGLYFYTVKIGNEFSATKKMLLVK